MSKVTVLVAAYNAEAYLPRCLDSLLCQSHRDFQAVCVDDGSTDGTQALLRRYAASDSRIEVIALDSNHGQAFARNEGLKTAKGDYVCFLDADDWLDSDALRLAVEEFDSHPEADCVLFDVEYVYSDHSEMYAMPDFDSLTGEEAFRLSLDWQIHGVYMVRAELHRRYPYDDCCRSYSDDNTTRMHFLASREVRRCRGVYHYVQHSASATHQTSVRRFDYLRANESMKRQLMAVGAGEDVMRQWETVRLKVLVDNYMFYHVHGRELSREDRRYGMSEMHRVWDTLERNLLDSSVTRIPGYHPTPCWWTFRMQEWIFFTLRDFLGKNR